MEKRKIGVIGIGHVGAHVAYSILIQGLADEVVLIDRSEKKLTAEVQDLRDAVAYMPHRAEINPGDFCDLKDCDIVIYSIGNTGLLVGNENRTAELDFTIPIVRTLAKNIKESGFSGILINVANPCDVVTREMAKILELPKGHVFGTGTGLDTSRLLSVLSRKTGIDHKSIHAYMIGEHGNKQFCPWSCASFGSEPLEQLAKRDELFNFDQAAVQKEAIGGGWVTFAGKRCTEYGISATTARMVAMVLRDEKTIIPASTELDGEYGEKDVFVGVPCVIGKDGVEKVIELPLNEKEKEEFHACCDGIRENIKHSETI